MPLLFYITRGICHFYALDKHSSTPPPWSWVPVYQNNNTLAKMLHLLGSSWKSFRNVEHLVIYIFDSNLVWRMQQWLLLEVKNSYSVDSEFLTFSAYSLNLPYQFWVEFIFVYQTSLKRTFKTSTKSPNMCSSIYVCIKAF